MNSRHLHPPGWPRASGYCWGMAASGYFVCVAGMVGTNVKQQFVSPHLVPQIEQALRNGLEVLHEAGGQAQDIVRMNWYLRDRQTYQAERQAIGEIYRQLMGDHYPAMTVVEVSALMDEEALVEIELTAIVPRPPVST
jgi:enamine deaminase RidA (YjgF/YER057c/UK114 family)